MADEARAESSGGEPSPLTIPALPSESLRNLAWTGCGISRDRTGLTATLAELRATKWALPEHLTLPDIERRNMHQLTALIARMALWREESRGGHYRSDFPEKNLNFAVPSAISRSAASGQEI